MPPTLFFPAAREPAAVSPADGTSIPATVSTPASSRERRTGESRDDDPGRFRRLEPRDRPDGPATREPRAVGRPQPRADRRDLTARPKVKPLFVLYGHVYGRPS
jgi:hypothetical protein